MKAKVALRLFVPVVLLFGFFSCSSPILSPEDGKIVILVGEIRFSFDIDNQKITAENTTAEYLKAVVYRESEWDYLKIFGTYLSPYEREDKYAVLNEGDGLKVEVYRGSELIDYQYFQIGG